MRIVTLAVLAVLIANQAWAGVVTGVPSVPEPTTLGLLVLGVGGVALVRFRNRK
jgi:hypothetical protein